MQQKEDSSTGEQSLEHDRRGLSFEDKYVCLQQEYQKLKRRLRNVWDERYFWMWAALEAQAERDCLREELQELAQERRNHD